MQHYQTRQDTITVNRVDYRIHCLLDNQQFYDHEQRAEALGISPATWPLFGVVWPSSRVLAETACLLPLEGRRVLEIGCGIALTSIVLHRMGVDITASDYHPLAGEFLQRNLQINRLLPLKYQPGNWESENPLLGEFDLILGSDVLYEPAHAEAVSRFIDRHSAPGVQVIIVDPNRGNRANFTKKMIARGFAHHFEHFDRQQPNEKRCRGRILYFQRYAARV